jgi:TPR repeat protein
MLVCYFCGSEKSKETSKFCVDCGKAKWDSHDVDQSTKISQYTEFLKDIFFDQSLEETETLSLRARERFKISFHTHKKIIDHFLSKKETVQHLAQFKLEFDKNLIDAFAGHDTYLRFRVTNLTDTELLKVTIHWDDPETPDDLDLNIVSKNYVKPKQSLVIGGTHIFSRIGMKEISDLLIKVTDQFQESATFRASSFSFKVGNSEQRITQNISTHNQISIEGRGVVDASGMGAERAVSAASQITEPDWVNLPFSYIFSDENLTSEISPIQQNNVLDEPQEKSEPVNTTDFDENDIDSIKEGANRNILLAVHLLGKSYLNGHKLEKNYGRAMECFMRAAYQNFSRSQYNIGLMYLNGWGVQKDIEIAIDWFEKASKQNHSGAMLQLGQIYLEFIHNEKLALTYFIEASKQNNGRAFWYLGNCYRDGIGVPKNEFEAKKYYELSVKNGFDDALNDLGDLFYHGKGVIKDTKTAAEHYLKLAYQNNLKAQYNLAILYYIGEGVPHDYQLAIDWALKAAKQNHSQSQLLLGEIFADSNYFGKDIDIAIEWYKKAQENGETQASEALESLQQSLPEQDLSPQIIWTCDSPAMDESLKFLHIFFDVFDNLTYGEDEILNKNSFAAHELSTALIEVICQQVCLLNGWPRDLFVGILVENPYSTVFEESDPQGLDNFDGQATVIYKVGVATIDIRDNLLNATSSSLWSDLELGSFCFWGSSGENEMIYFGTQSSNTYFWGGAWNVDNISFHQESVNNANSWINRILSISNGQVDRNQVLYPDDKNDGNNNVHICDGYTWYGEVDHNKLLTGYGTCIWDDGTEYKGNYLNGHKNGYGVQTWSSGTIYEGDWVNSQMQGFGKIIWTSGAFYEGEWWNSKQHGNGVEVLTNGVIKEGVWHDGVFVKA